MKRILVVGAGGFAGGFIVEEGLRRGYEVWAGVRSSTSREWLTDERIRFAVFDFTDATTIADGLRQAMPGDERWDWIVFNLGATKVVRYSDFDTINYGCLSNFLTALAMTSKEPEKLLYMSSLSALGPRDEKNYSPLTEETIPIPNTRYGASKLKAELRLMSQTAIPYIIFRSTGIYGPRDHDYFLMFESISKGFDFSVGFRRQMLSFIYVEDLARAVYDALEKAPTGEVYNIAEPRSYTQKEFRRISAEVLGKKLVLPVTVPVWGLKAVTGVAGFWGMWRNRPSTLNSDKYHIMKQRNWRVDVTKAERAFGFRAAVPLEEGVRRSVEWYRKEGWL